MQPGLSKRHGGEVFHNKLRPDGPSHQQGIEEACKDRQSPTHNRLLGSAAKPMSNNQICHPMNLACVLRPISSFD